MALPRIVALRAGATLALDTTLARTQSISSNPARPWLALTASRTFNGIAIANSANWRRRMATAAAHPTPSHQAQGDNKIDRPLDDITVVSLEQAIAGPFCTRHLADLGARVIKVERPGTGDFCRHQDTRVNGLCSHFVWVNRNKESLALDLKNADDMKVLRGVLEKADVLVQNLAPGATARLGLSHEALKEQHPSLIVCDISGYGQDGPYRSKKAYDLLIQSEAGVLAVTGTKTEPVKVGVSIADIAAGMYAYTNILSALYHRKKTGIGRRIDISMLECMAEWMGFPMYYAYNGAPKPMPNGAAHASIYPYGPFETGSGDSVMLGIQNEREWSNFCSVVLEKPEVTTDQRFANNSLRVQNSEALGAAILDVFSGLTAEAITTRLDKASIANAKVNQLDDVWAHPQLQARNRWAKVETPNGPIPTLKPVGSGEEEVARMDPIPHVGAHNENILREFGFSKG